MERNKHNEEEILFETVKSMFPLKGTFHDITQKIVILSFKKRKKIIFQIEKNLFKFFYSIITLNA